MKNNCYWTQDEIYHNLQLLPSKTSHSLWAKGVSLGPEMYMDKLKLLIYKKPKILVVTFDPMLTFKTLAGST